MSYHNNYNGGYNRGGGFRNNNNYGFNRNNGGGGFHNNEPRINETDVPQSKHTIFIRGLHGDTSTDEIQEYIGDKIGRVSFDFVKLAQDGSKVFVAVRFEKRDEAKQFMETYSNREFMGVRCELSWFRDIRRFCAYQRARQQRSNSQRRRRRSDSEESNGGGKRRSESPPIRRRSRSQESKSPARSGSRSHSRSESPDDRNAGENRLCRTRNRSDSRRKSRSSTRSSGGRSQSSHRSQSSQRSASSRRSEGECSRVSSRAQSRAESTAESRRSRRNSEAATQKRRRESSATSIKEEIKEKKIPKKESPLRIPLPTKTTPIKNSPSPVSQKSGYIPPPSMDMDIETSPQHTNNNVSTNPYPQHQQFQNYKPESTKVSYSMPMNGDSPPKMIIREPQPPAQYYPTVKVAERNSESILPPQPPASSSSSSSLLPPAVAAPPVAPAVTMPTTPSFVPRQIGRIEIVMPASLPLPPAPAPPVVVAQVTPPPPPPPSSLLMDGSAFGVEQQQKMADGSNAHMQQQQQQQQQLPSTNKLFGHLKSFQSALLSTVKYEIPAKDGEITGLRLSSMTSNDDDVEEVKAMEREQKLSRLNDDQMMRFLIQKKKFETAFRNDCETYAVVTRALLSKDESMQFTLKMSLHENMEDLHKQFMKRVDDHLDQLLAC